ncbi:Malonyl CoA-acyl carrier protein transacylase [Candidatus Xenohaliotis californiensis]|uniref:Malonyl CoA-acyl carrier protein transacylase n=1 Tax=Candidatus Xenohaliotis californiensis TaxID=84677 RepID=A0ABM9N8T4_9RICK|nr:Malonyl CoA-acyl carrier protein transacylase [Candidatus Xenohaliotis californiensis]
MIFIFPGQGVQFVGMGQQFVNMFSVARIVFEEVDDALGYSLSKLIKNGPIEELTMTEHAQPAIMATSMAILQSLLLEMALPFSRISTCALGHSLGEYSALCAAGSLSVWDAAKILKIRGVAMSNACCNGAMVAILGFDITSLNQLLAEANKVAFCQFANDNTEDQVVISGYVSAIDFIINNYKDFGIKKVIRLNVGGPFHSHLMSDAANALSAGLEHIAIYNPVLPIISNVTAQPVSNSSEIARLLVSQITSKVRWRESVLYAAENSSGSFIEIGPGSVLTKMVKKIVPNVNVYNISSPKDIDSILDFFKENMDF